MSEGQNDISTAEGGHALPVRGPDSLPNTAWFPEHFWMRALSTEPRLAPEGYLTLTIFLRKEEKGNRREVSSPALLNLVLRGALESLVVNSTSCIISVLFSI